MPGRTALAAREWTAEAANPLPRDHIVSDAKDVPAYPYVTHLEVLHGPLERIDVPALVAACTDRWYNQTLCRVNESVVRLGVVQGEYHWHKHDADDEFFYVVDGRFWIDLPDRVIELSF